MEWGAFRDTVDWSDAGAVEATRAALSAAAGAFVVPGVGVRLRSTAWLVTAVYRE